MVTRAAFEAILEPILAAAPGCEGALLFLHGAMVLEDCEDGEGELLERLRAKIGAAPVVVSGVELNDLDPDDAPLAQSDASVNEARTVPLSAAAQLAGAEPDLILTTAAVPIAVSTASRRALRTVVES